MVHGIIFISVDALRADHLNVYGYKSEKTSPNIDLLSKDSLIFLRHISAAPYTSLSFYSMFTSSYPIKRSRYNEPCPIPRHKPVFPQDLNRLGFYTIALQDSNPFLSSKYGYSKGFNLFINYGRIQTVRRSSFLEKILSSLIKSSKRRNFVNHYILGFPKPIQGSTSVISDSITIIKHLVERDKNFFIWIHLMDTHGPHNGGNLFKRYRFVIDRIIFYKRGLCYCPSNVIDSLMAIYNDEIRKVDKNLGVLINWLKDQGLYDDVTLILTSDHGEEFCDHGGYGHTAKLYDELIKVPLIIKLAKRRKVGTIRQVTSHLNLGKLISLIAKLLLSQPSLLNDDLILNCLKLKSNGALSFAYNSVHDVISYRTSKWKLISYFRGNNLKPYKIELFDLKNDLFEKHNILENIDKDLIRQLMRPILILRRIQRIQYVKNIVKNA